MAKYPRINGKISKDTPTSIIAMAETNIDINGGHSQVNPAATQAVQNNYYGTPVPLHEEVVARTVVVLGAGVDTAAGFSNPCSLVPKITERLETDEGKEVDAALRKLLKGLRFSYAKFVDNAIERLAHDLDRERETICTRVTQELEQNDSLDEGQRKMGRLIVRLFHKITEVKDGAAIDEETEELIREVTGIDPTEETIIDFSHVNYTKTFEGIVKYIRPACTTRRTPSCATCTPTCLTSGNSWLNISTVSSPTSKAKSRRTCTLLGRCGHTSSMRNRRWHLIVWLKLRCLYTDS